ncbi:SAM and SH3 domain-containing protein 1a isoform X4 [Tachysurus ichikawai]
MEADPESAVESQAAGGGVSDSFSQLWSDVMGMLFILIKSKPHCSALTYSHPVFLTHLILPIWSFLDFSPSCPCGCPEEDL